MAPSASLHRFSGICIETARCGWATASDCLCFINSYLRRKLADAVPPLSEPTGFDITRPRFACFRMAKAIATFIGGAFLILFLSISISAQVAPPGNMGSQAAPAHAAARHFMRGANFGNYLEAPKGANWGAQYDARDFENLHNEGFDHVRLPVRWTDYAGTSPDYQLSPIVFHKVDFLVTNALAQKLAVIVNLHHFDEFTDSPSTQSNKLIAVWNQVAAHYSASPSSVAFEILNEPRDAATTAVMNPIYAAVIQEIRKTNPDRTIFVGPGKWNQVNELKNLKLPEGDRNLIVTVHCYEPFYFTHQGAAWAGPDTKVAGIQFPGPPSTPLVPDPSLKLSGSVSNWIHRYNTVPGTNNPCHPEAFRKLIRVAREWSDRNHRPIHFGEFGCYTQADVESRARFHTEFRRALDEARIGWAIWDWKAGFRYWDDRKKAPVEGMREALFGNARP